MSYDLAVWEGDRPASDDEAVEMYADLAERYLEEAEEPPTPKIARYVDALLARWPDEGPSSPWASSGTGDASGPVLCVNIVSGREVEVSAYAAELAKEHGLACYDLQQDRLLA